MTAILSTLTPRMRHALMYAEGQAIKATNWPQYPGEFAPRTMYALEKRGLVEKMWTGPDAGKYVISRRGGEVLAELLTEDSVDADRG